MALEEDVKQVSTPVGDKLPDHAEKGVNTNELPAGNQGAANRNSSQNFSHNSGEEHASMTPVYLSYRNAVLACFSLIPIARTILD
ncbi:hypothetical protein GYMLUDRAFT_45289 [Collybiopsis luxurians FD-317 M1]|uniref:Uncharacterized protein n=1 Tax=Collybiopsis luxurians FD-317 M1 TaxID=944289 RepID=A0A0D0C7B7_9AGAR|nr:hypothetical protein GYMLUDRAFT_45289 [Collybiopsis luxurians FD-317 M1]